MSDSAKTSRRGDDVAPGRAERITLLVALVIVAAMICLIVVARVRGGDDPASIRTTASWEAVVERDGTWYLPVEVRNAGDRPTDVVRVDVVLETDDPAHPERADLDFAFLSGGEAATATVAFDERPTRDNVTFDVVSITDP